MRQFFDDPLVGEIIVVDDASSDGTRDWLQQEQAAHPILKPAFHDRNQGATGSRNTGIAAAACEFIFFWDDDMLLLPRGGLGILLDELRRCGGNVIAPASSFIEDEPPPVLPRPGVGKGAGRPAVPC